MKGYNVYSRIQQLREKGFSQRSVAKQLFINRDTVKRYWSMPVDEYETNFSYVCRSRLLDEYRDTIIIWLRDYPTLSAAQVCDWLKEHYNAIANQRLILEKYAKENGFENLKFMADDGYSGTNFNRPSFKGLMLLVENGEVETIIVKDMSRFGREYLEVGRYTEIVFPNYDVRFIAIGDGIDSLYGNDDFTPFKNIINELYAKDCSRKIRAAKRAKAETGAWLGGKPLYGYMRDPENPKSHLVPDEESAEVVKLIFSLCVGGKGPNQIARELKKCEILTPAHYYYRKEGKKNAKLNLEHP